jgi:hypothetical protein
MASIQFTGQFQAAVSLVGDVNLKEVRVQATVSMASTVTPRLRFGPTVTAAFNVTAQVVTKLFPPVLVLATLRLTAAVASRLAMRETVLAAIPVRAEVLPALIPGGFPAVGDVFLYEVEGRDSAPLSALTPRWFARRTAGVDACDWTGGKKPEMTDMPTTTIDYGAPYTGPGTDGAHLWIDACPFDPAVNYPSSGPLDIQVLRDLPTPSIGALEVVGNVQEGETFNNSKEQDGFIDGAKGAISFGGVGSSSVVKITSLIPDTRQVVRNGVNKFHGRIDHRAQGEIRLTDSSERQGVACGYIATLRSDVIKLEAPPDSGEALTLPDSLRWTAEVFLYIAASCNLGLDHNPRRIMAQSRLTGETASSGGGLLPVQRATLTYEAQASDDFLSNTTGGNSASSFTGAKLRNPNSKSNITERTVHYFLIPTVAGKMQSYLNDLRDNRLPGLTTGAWAFPWFRGPNLRVRKQGSRLQFSILPEILPPLVWDDPYVARRLISAGNTVTAL